MTKTENRHSEQAQNRRGTVRAVCISTARGTEKTPVEEGHFLVDFGIEGDAHGGKWHRQVSLLSYDKVEEFNRRGADVKDGAFGENLVVEGLDFRSMAVGTRLYAGTAVLEMTQIGKECHSHCAIYKKMGECIMPTGRGVCQGDPGRDHTSGGRDGGCASRGGPAVSGGGDHAERQGLQGGAEGRERTSGGGNAHESRL